MPEVAWKLHGDLTGKNAGQLIRDLFHLTLAVAHAPRYQAEHQEALAQDWIHLPIPRQHQTLRHAASLGARVARLLDPFADVEKDLKAVLGKRRRQLAVATRKDDGAVREQDLVVEIAHYGAAKGGWERRPAGSEEDLPASWGETGDLHLNKGVRLRNVPEKVWRYQLGGYPLIKKWLGYRDRARRGRGLSLAEVGHLRSMVHRLAALSALGEELDEVYESVLRDAFAADELGLRVSPKTSKKY